MTALDGETCLGMFSRPNRAEVGGGAPDYVRRTLVLQEIAIMIRTVWGREIIH